MWSGRAGATVKFELDDCVEFPLRSIFQKEMRPSVPAVKRGRRDGTCVICRSKEGKCSTCVKQHVVYLPSRRSCQEEPSDVRLYEYTLSVESESTIVMMNDVASANSASCTSSTSKAMIRRSGNSLARGSADSQTMPICTNGTSRTRQMKSSSQPPALKR